MKNIKKNGERYMLGSRKNEIKYFNHNKSRYYHTLKFLRNKFSSKQKFNILDIGTSPFTLMLKNHFPNASIYTLDYSVTFCKICQKSGIKFMKQDLLDKGDELFGVKFDVITFLETLEHVHGSHLRVMKKIFKNMKKHGICIVQTPNVESLKNRILKIIPLNLWEKMSTAPKTEKEFVHFKEYKKCELDNLIKSIHHIRLVSSNYTLYYDNVSSCLVYRKHVGFFKPILYVYYFVVKAIPSLRLGLEVIFVKN